MRHLIKNSMFTAAALMLAVGRLFRRRSHDEAIRRTMPWLVASGAIVPGSIYTTSDRRERR